MLGAPKVLAILLSGEMRDTAQLNSFALYGLEKFFSRQECAELLRSFPGISNILPKGGNDIWAI
jgi:phospholipid:diacylglycerol acyltransferase